MTHRVIVLFLIAIMARHVALTERLNEADRLKVMLEEFLKLRNAKESQETKSPEMESQKHSPQWPDYLFQDLDNNTITAKDIRNPLIFYGVNKCTPQSKRSIHEQFRRISHFDPMYMATSAEEAALFPNLNWEISKRSDYMYIVNRIARPLLDYTKRDLMKIKLFRRMLEKKLGLPHYNVFENDIRDMGRNSKRDTIPLCTANRASDTSVSLLTLCNSCSRTRHMPQNVYPAFINEKACQSSKCFQDVGNCKQTYTDVAFLRRTPQCKAVTENGNTVYLEVWESFSVSIGTGCQCTLSTTFV